MSSKHTISPAGDPFRAAPHHDDQDHPHPSTVEVESSSRPGLFHDVTLEPEESCSCEATIPLCRHIRIARIRAAKARPHACMDGWVFVGRVVESEHDLDGEVVEYERVPCRRCADSR
jgi:hypothetical protein